MFMGGMTASVPSVHLLISAGATPICLGVNKGLHIGNGLLLHRVTQRPTTREIRVAN